MLERGKRGALFETYSREQREAIFLRYVLGSSIDEIAERLGLDFETVERWTRQFAQELPNYLDSID